MDAGETFTMERLVQVGKEIFSWQLFGAPAHEMNSSLGLTGQCC